ncbi:MAG TPA: DUF190 domain-containing protein [Capillimicrobium sp.]|nr:DUF190 domain-containing protein [Capillimicrobium sp.]
MTADALRVTAYLGERDRVGGAFLADELVALYARHGVATSIVLRGAEGFGARHGLRTDLLLTLSEDLPVVSVAVDERARIEALLPELDALRRAGLVTVEGTRLRTAGPAEVPDEPSAGAVRLTVFVGRGQRAAGRAAHVAVVDAMHASGVAGATVLVGVDGTAGAVRRRARFFGRNADVPAVVVGVAEGEVLAPALDAVRTVVPDAVMTIDAVQLCKRDGERLAEPRLAGEGRQRLTVVCSEQARAGEVPLYRALVRRLRAEGAAGATALRGQWGYHGDHAPHGDRLWSVRRRVPVVTSVVDTAERTARWWAIADELTGRTGLVTVEDGLSVRPAPRHSGS